MAAGEECGLCGLDEHLGETAFHPYCDKRLRIANQRGFRTLGHLQYQCPVGRRRKPLHLGKARISIKQNQRTLARAFEIRRHGRDYPCKELPDPGSVKKAPKLGSVSCTRVRPDCQRNRDAGQYLKHPWHKLNRSRFERNSPVSLLGNERMAEVECHSPDGP